MTRGPGGRLAWLTGIAIMVTLMACSQPDQGAKTRVDTTLPDTESAMAGATPTTPVPDPPLAGEARPDTATTGPDELSTEAETPPDDPADDAPHPQLITSPNWIRRPSAADTARYYPDRAMRMNSEGEVTLACSVTAAGTLEACLVEEELPENVGFGDAALRLSRLFRMQPYNADGSPTAGGTVRVPLRFRLPSDG